MGRTQLKALLGSGSSIVFDARSLQPNGEPQPGAPQPFFTSTLLKYVIAIKTVERVDPNKESAANLQTRLFFPFDHQRLGKGGTSLLCGKDFSTPALEAHFNIKKIDPERIEGDLKKLDLLRKAPSFSPFLLRDLFERAGFKTDNSYFRVSDAETHAMRENLKSKLKPLAAMALNLPPTVVGNEALDLLARKLWELDDPKFLKPLASALKIPEHDTTDVLYAWIGVSFFEREFAKREGKVRQLTEWLASKPPFADNAKPELVRAYEEDRAPVRDRLRWAWTTSGKIFERFKSSYDALFTGGGDARPFVEYLQHVRADFAALGARLSVIEQCLSFYEVTASQKRGSALSDEILREVAQSMREAAMDGEARAAA